MDNNRTYYGEYSLTYWIKLILKGSIELPEYQRTFVWEKDNYNNLIESFTNKQFIPPVTIGAYKSAEGQKNLIIDGQQRLTSIFLAYIERFPKKEAATNSSVVSLINENDDIEDDDDNENMIEWTFKELILKGRKREEIISKCSSEKYEILNHHEDDFFNKNYLGFSYIVPSTVDESEQQKFFSTLFRNINIRGKSLYVLESRASLYFLSHALKEWFDPVFCKDISSSVVDKSKKSRMDFVRYVSLLSQYNHAQTERRIGYGYAKKMENYYESYIYSVVKEEDSSMFGCFTNVFADKNYKPQLDLLNSCIGELAYRRNYISIIDMDIYFFGLIYFFLFKKKTLNIEQKDKLTGILDKAIKKIKTDSNHVKSPACLKHLRERISKSIETYHPFFY